MLIAYAKSRPEIFNTNHMKDDAKTFWSDLINSKKLHVSTLTMVGDVIKNVLSNSPNRLNNNNNKSPTTSKKLNILDYIINK